MVAGFLSSGKTTLIKRYIENTNKKYKVIQCESGIEKLENSTRVFSIGGLVREISNSFEDHIYVEYNGTWSVTEFVTLIQSSIETRIFTVYVMDLCKIYTYMKNFPAMILEQLNYVDEVVTINRGNPQEFKYVKQTISQIRPWISYRVLEKSKLR